MSEAKRYTFGEHEDRFVSEYDYDALRDENTRLMADYAKLFKLAEPIAKMLGELSIQPIGCSREQELAWKMAVKNLRHYQQGYEASVAIEAALTATSQEGQHGSR